MKRGYQADFYTLSPRVRNLAIRQQKAEKIVYALTRHADRSPPFPLCLDIGCSSGIITAAVASLCDRALGLDYDATALEVVSLEARTRVQFIRGDAMAVPLADNTVDVIVCAQVYEHVPDAERLMEEMYRVLTPGGVVFFSGPNWLFPIEPHYFLPFLHWLPGRAADVYLRLAGKGDHYYEQLRHVWGLRRLVSRFDVHDISIEIMQHRHLPTQGRARPIWSALPATFWRLWLPLLPNYNWILRKPER